MPYSLKPKPYEPTNVQRARGRRPPFRRWLAVPMGALLVAFVLAGTAQAQGQTPTSPYEAPQLVGPASSQAISDPGALRLRWRAAKGPDAEDNERYHRRHQLLVVKPKADSQSTATAMRENQPQIAKTYPDPTSAAPPPPAPDSAGPYPVVGNWFPETESRAPPSERSGVWVARLTYPTVGYWYPGEEDRRASFPRGEYVWQVRLMGETGSGQEQTLASSRVATFIVSAGDGESAGDDEADPVDKPSSPPQEPSAQTPEGVTLTLMPRGGLFLSGVSSFEDVSGEVGSALDGQQSVFTYGGSAAFGSRDGPVNLRLTGLRTNSSLVSTTEGVETAPDSAGTGRVRDRMFVLTGDVIVRPIPRFLIQPYAIGGMGAQRRSIRPRGGGSVDSRWDVTAQMGAGVDVRLGSSGVTLGVEVVDYLTGFTGSGGGVQHDAFVFLTLGVPIF